MIKPHGPAHQTELVNRCVTSDLNPSFENMPKIQLDNRLASDCEMIAIGGFTPLQGFMTQKEAQSVIDQMCLPDGTLWTIPILLPVSPEHFQQTGTGQQVALTDITGCVIALLEVSDKFTLNLDHYCQQVFKTTEMNHPGVRAVIEAGNHFLAGKITLVNRPRRETIAPGFFIDPADTRALFKQRQWKTIVAFQTRNPIHRAHEYIIKCAMETLDGAFIHPLVGETKADDIPADVRMDCYQALIQHYFNPEKIQLSVLPTAMRYAGPREAVHHSIIRKNYGCTHMIIGRDHAGVHNYYGSYEAQELVASVVDKLGMVPLNFENTFYSKTCESIVSEKTCPPDGERVTLSGTMVREMLQKGIRPPNEFTRPEVADILIAWTKQQVPA